MNHIYKTIWNKTKNAFDVVAENVSSKGKKTAGSKSGAENGTERTTHFLAVLTPLAAMLFVQSSLAEVIVGDTNTQVRNANNGVQIIDIATANAAGISHNRYLNYNVDKTGQVLNNAAQSATQLSVMTELAGKIMTNANLNTSAKVILNEVTGANRSALNGYIEVAGAKADVILANPYGITCSGCGFINTDRATLTTGTPKFSPDGNITGFNITQGNISIADNGLNANSTGLLRLLSRNLSIDGQVNAQQLEAVTGANAYDYTTGKATAIAGTDAAGQYAIDSTLLGGLYANRISLISTEQGVGVRMAGDAAASAADFTLSAAGDIQLNNKINAKQAIDIQNSSAQQQKLNIQGGLTANSIAIGDVNAQKFNVDVAGGTLYAGSTLDLQSQAFNANSAKIQAKDALKLNANADIALQNTAIDAADLQMKSNAFTAQDSQLKSAQNLNIQTAQDLKFKNTDAEVQNNIVLNTANGNMELAGGKLKAGNALDLKANQLSFSAQTSAANTDIQVQQFTLDENGLIVSQNNTAITASNADLLGQLYSSAANLNISGTLNSGNNTLISVQNLNTVNAKDLNLKGLWEAGNLTLTALNSLQQAGAVYAQNNLLLNANAINLTGAVQAGAKLNANAVQQLTVDSQAQLFGSDSIELSADAIQLDGYAGAENSMTAITANNLATGSTARLETNGLLTLQSKNADVDLQGKTYAQTQSISARKNINIAAGAAVTTVGNLNITADTLNNTGAVNTQQLTKAQLKKLNNQGSLISDKFELSTLDSVNNSGKLISNQDLELNTAALTNAQNSILAGNKNLNLHINGTDFNNQGTVTAMGSLLLDAAQINTVNNGSLSAGNQLTIDTQSLGNAGKLNASAVNISASEVNNSASIIGSTLQINAAKKADSNIINSGEIYAANQADLTVSDKIDNTGYIYTVNNQNAGALNLTAQQLLNGNKGIISTNNLLLKTDEIVNAGQISADSAVIEGKTSLQTTLTNTGKALSNTGIYLYNSLNAKNLSSLNNSGDVYVNLNASDSLSEISVADLINNSGAYLYLGNNASFNQTGLVSKNAGEIYVQGNGSVPLKTSINFTKLDNSGGTLNVDAATLNFSNNYQHTGKLNAMNSAAVNAKAEFTNSSTGDVNLYDSDLNANSLTNNNQIKTSGVSKIAAETKLVNNKLIHSAGSLFIDTAALTNAAKSGIISLNNLLINTQRSDVNTITNFGDVYAAAYLVLGNENSKKTNVYNKMNSNQSQVSGGNLQAGNGIEVYGHDFENNYNVLVNNGDINLALSGKFLNERTYYGDKINITETWNTPKMYLTSDNDWGHESFDDSASNTVIYTTQVAIKGGGDDGVQASVVTETWKKSTDVKAGTETNYDTIKNYLNGDIGQAKIGANNGNITINYVDDSKNIGGKIYAAGNGAGMVNIDGPNNFTNQSIDLYRDKLFELKYLLLTDHSNRAGAVVSLDSKNPGTIQLSNIDDDGDFNRSNNYIDAIKNLSGIYYSYRDTNMDKYATVKDRSGDTYTVTYNVKNVIDAIRNKVKSDGYKALVPQNVQSNTAQSKATVTGNTVLIKAKDLTNESESNLNHLALNNDKKLCENLGLTCQIDKPAEDKKENADAPQDGTDVETPKKQVDTTKYTEDVRIQAVNPISQSPAVNLSLPVSDYGQYIITKNPNSKYLVESNPLYGENSNVIGSDYLQEKLGINPDKLMKRLGDNGYEMNLVQQQLISSLGTAVLYANSSMADQMQKLFDQASDQKSTLGLKYGTALTPEQIGNLKQDIVWMVATEVAGQKVLVPQVYLSKATVDSISTSGAVIEGKTLTYLDVESLDNKNAAIRGGTVVVDAKKDINNIGAQIKGGNVFLTSKEGSINNITEVQTSGSDSDRKTSIGAVSGIVSDGALVMDAAKDINNIGAKLKAGETLALKAGENINILSIQNAEASSKSIKNGRSSTSSVTNMGSVLEAGGNVVMESGKDTTIKGSDVTAGGLMYVKTGGDFKLLADQDTTETKTSTSRSGFGVGGGIWGKETVETTDFKGTNKASNLSVGSLIVDSEGKAVIEGSNIGIRDKDSTSLIRGKAGVDILDGKDEERHEKVTTTSTYLKSTKGSASNDNPIYGTAADGIQKDKKGKFNGNATQNMYGASTEDEPDVKVNASAKAEKTKLSMTAQAGASASAKGEAALKISETTKTVEKSGSSTSVASNIVSAGNLAIMSDNTVNVRGSNVDVDGKLAIAAKNLLVEAGKNTSYASRDVKRTSVGIFAEGDASAQAGAQAGGKVGVNGASLGVNAGASAEANGTVTFGAKTEHQNETMNSLTHTNSSLKSGSDMLIKVTDTATFHGADVQAGQWDKDGKPVGAPAALRIEAKNIKNLAVQDTHSETSTSSSKLAGVYLSGSVSAQASAQAGASADATNINPLSAGASASAGVSAEVGAGLRTAIENNEQSYDTVTNKGNNFKATGSFVRIAENEILDQATQVNASSIYQSAAIIKDEAVHDSQTFHSNSQSHEARLGLYAEAGASANVSAQASLGATASTSTGTQSSGARESSSSGAKSTKVAAGVSAQYSMESSKVDSKDTQARSSSFTSSGNITSISSGETQLNGTQFNSTGGDINLEASKLTYNAVHDTHESSSTSRNVDVNVKVGVDLKGVPDIELGAEYGQNKTNAKSSTAVVGGLNAAGNIKVRANEANFEGTALTGNNVSIQANSTTFTSAESTSTSNSTGFGVGVGFENAQKSTKARENVKREVTKADGNTVTDTTHKSGGVSASFGIAKNNSTKYTGSEITAKSFEVTAPAPAAAPLTLNEAGASPVSLASASQLVSAPELARNADGKAIIHNGAPVIIAKQTEVNIPAIESSNDNALLGAPVTVQPAASGDAASSKPTLSMENVKFKSVGSDGKAVEDNSINKTNTSAVQVTSTTKKDSKSGFELGGEGSADSSDLRQIKDNRNAYSGTRTPGTVRQATETLTQNDQRGTENTNQSSTHRNVADAVINKAGQLRDLLRPTTTP
ncbi:MULTISPECIES: two-partner secretion domain-containing protein [Acinetobacter]|uniref:two-partner secretion domain-containing protein n=1 Tax=Acinetobacter TaxID=469 RepID=UPI001F46A3E6|nr:MULTISPECIES: hemagglutinin repeat-containing protein [Acinetobacter]MDV2456294.1 filamentous hemagglutinin N-terminal domain-containing protein [Acinetobacter towneri]UIZ56714.1 filamentous hemagglutinin N-terminal domain-containing protein [Acinetobacter sp. SCLZS86]